MRRSSAFTKVVPMAVTPLASSPRKSIVARLRLRASTVLAMQRLNPFAHRHRRRRRRRSATTDQIVTTQHVSALASVSMRSDDRQHEARARAALETVKTTMETHAGHHHAPGEYLVGLSTFFFACDYDEDGALVRSELQIMLEILLHAKTAMRQPSRLRRRTGGEPTVPAATARPPPVAILLEDDDEITETTTLEQFLARFGHRLYGAGVELPSVDFVRRCQRLKRGFQRCDTNGDCVMSVQELEIALQKLDLVVADDDLSQLVQTLDANGDGTIEWSEMIRAAWMNTHLGPARNRNSVLLLDALADVPAAAISRPRYLHGPGETVTTKKNHMKRPSWLLRTALKMHLVLTQDAVDKRHSADDKTSDTPPHPRDPSKSRVERLGVRILTRISMQQVQARKRVTLQTKTNKQTARRSATAMPSPSSLRLAPRASNLREASPRQDARVSTTIARTKLTALMRRRVIQIEWIATILAAVIGVACGLVSIHLESLVPRIHGQDVFTGDVVYFAYVIAINIGVSLLEVNWMYLVAVVCAFRMTVATRLTLYPQDAEREFLTRAIARAALQVGHRTDRLFGMNPMKDSPRLVLLCSFLVYRSKRYILNFLVKLLLRRVLWRAAAKVMLSVVVLPINAVLNAWTLRNVLHHCRVTILGPPCITALLQDFFDRQEAKLLPYQRVDYLRVLGCVLVSKRRVHPNLEIIIDQVRAKWVSLATWPVGDGCSCLLCPDEPCELHELDDVDRFIASLMLNTSRLSPATAAASVCEILDVDHQRNMFFFLMLALIVDGELSLSERRLYLRACHTGRVQFNWAAVRRLKNQFFNGYGLRLDDFFELVLPRALVPGASDDVLATSTWVDTLLSSSDRLSSLLAV